MGLDFSKEGLYVRGELEQVRTAGTDPESGVAHNHQKAGVSQRVHPGEREHSSAEQKEAARGQSGWGVQRGLTAGAGFLIHISSLT